MKANFKNTLTLYYHDSDITNQMISYFFDARKLNIQEELADILKDYMQPNGMSTPLLYKNSKNSYPKNNFYLVNFIFREKRLLLAAIIKPKELKHNLLPINVNNVYWDINSKNFSSYYADISAIEGMYETNYSFQEAENILSTYFKVQYK